MTRFFIWPGAGPAARADSTTAFARTTAAKSWGSMSDDVVWRSLDVVILYQHYISEPHPIFCVQKHAGSQKGHHLTNSLINVCRRVAAQHERKKE